jgi:multiple sugar transport system permease protein
VGLTNWYGSANNAGQYRDLFPVVITGALVTIVPLIAGFVALQRYWAGGLTMGSVK